MHNKNIWYHLRNPKLPYPKVGVCTGLAGVTEDIKALELP